MKKLLISFLILVGLLVTGCASEKEVTLEEINNYVEVIKTHAIYPDKDNEQYIKDLEDFKKALQNVPNELEEYAEIQIEAIDLRIDGIKKDDGGLITSSSSKQATALQILENIR